MSDCVFCAIVSGEAPASLVHRDEHTVAFLDIAPATRGHLLVVPRRHAARLADLDPEDGARMFRVAQRIAVALRGAPLDATGVNLFLADGEVAGQEVLHAHLHVLPRREGDGFRVSADFGEPGRDDLDDQAAAIRSALGSTWR